MNEDMGWLNEEMKKLIDLLGNAGYVVTKIERDEGFSPGEAFGVNIIRKQKS